MKFEELSQDHLDKLEGKIAVARYSSLPGSNKVDDALLFDKGTEVDFDKLHGYKECPVSVWFDFVAKPVSDLEALSIIENALLSLEPRETAEEEPEVVEEPAPEPEGEEVELDK